MFGKKHKKRKIVFTVSNRVKIKIPKLTIFRGLPRRQTNTSKIFRKDLDKKNVLPKSGNFINRLFFLFKFVLFFTVLLILFFSLKSLKTDEVVCSSQYGICNKIVSEKLKSIEGKSLMDSKKLASGILSDLVMVEKYSVHLKFPTKLQVDIIEQKTSFSLKNQGEDSYLNVTNGGVVVSQTSQTSLPILQLTDSFFKIGETVDERTKFALSLAETIFQNYPVEKAEKVRDNLIIELEGDVKLIFPLQGDRDYLLGAFVLIFSELKKEAGDIRIDKEKNITMDLRYQNPVLKFE